MALQEPWQQLANSLLELTASHETAANATQGVQQAVVAVANLPPPDQVILQQVLQLLQQQVANSNNLQQRMANLQQQLVASSNNLQQQMANIQQQQVANNNNLQQQMANLQQQLVASSNNLQQQLVASSNNLQQQMQGDIGALRLEVRAGANASTRLTNSELPDSTPLHWLYNDQGQLPAQPAITRETLFDPQHVNAQAVDELLLHYGLLQQAQGLDANRRRFMLLRHLGAMPANK
ncbi:hypothetical protein QJQ45_010559 [Haematococcus lacustris]|nr:hypothetical protein QJQ45_010559 [Haematococcus lacustris]